MSNSQNVQDELSRRYRKTSMVVVAFLVLDVGLVVLAFFASNSIYRAGDRSIVGGLWIAILVFGLGAFVIRRTRFAAMRLTDIAADWTNMLRAGGVAAIVLIYCYPFRGAWQRVVTQLADKQ